MSSKSPLIGTTVRCFTVLDTIPGPGRKHRFLLKCNLCGSVVTRGSTAVHGGKILCDCSKARIPKERGMDRKSPLYNTYRAMLERCYNPNSRQYGNYGGRGITVCEEWQTFPPFEKWAYENGWAPGLTIDRIRVNGNYEPSNCRWADNDTQANNKQDTRLYTYKGKTMSMKQWSEATGVSYFTLRNRLDSGWTIAEAIEKPVRPTERVEESDRLISYRGESKLLTQWAQDLGIRFSTLRSRLERSGWDAEKAFTNPVKPQERIVSYNGESHSITEWAAITGISRITLYSRLNEYGWSLEKALTTPARSHKKR